MLDGRRRQGLCAGATWPAWCAICAGLAGTEGDARYVYGDTFFRVEYELRSAGFIATRSRSSPSATACAWAADWVWSQGQPSRLGAGLKNRDAGNSHRPLSRTLVADTSHRMPAGVGALLALTGHVITAEDALDIGLADAVSRGRHAYRSLRSAAAMPMDPGDGSRDKVVVTGAVEGFSRLDGPYACCAR